MLGLEMEDTFRHDTSLFSLAQKSRAMFSELQKELKELSGIDIDYCQNGFLKIAQTDEELSLFQQEMEHHRENGIQRSEEHTSELQSRGHLVCRLLLEKKNKKK